MIPAFSVIIPAYNEEVLLPGTLAALQRAIQATGETGEVLVVDNASTDRTADVARAGGARVVSEPVRQISRARNAGARHAQGVVLIFVDADTLIPETHIRRVLEAVRNGAAGGGSVMQFPAQAPGSARFAIDRWNQLSRWMRLAAGSFVFCRREAFDAVGGFSQEVYASEEIWFSRGLKKWAKPRGLRFKILTEEPVLTSGRKAEWYGPIRLFGWTLFLILVPFALRFRRFCAFWYERPGDPPAHPR